MAIRAILFDAGGVLYHRPREDRNLRDFLAGHNLLLRDRAILARALRAASFDVRSGRITRDIFYDAILRMHGLDEHLYAEGREMLLRDAADIELFPGVRETLDMLYDAGYQLAVVSDSGHPARDKVRWLARRGVSVGVWSAFVASCEYGLLKAEGSIFLYTLDLLGAEPERAVFIGHDTAELTRAAELGMTTIAFLPDDPDVDAHYIVSSFYALQDLFVRR